MALPLLFPFSQLLLWPGPQFGSSLPHPCLASFLYGQDGHRGKGREEKQERVTVAPLFVTPQHTHIHTPTGMFTHSGMYTHTCKYAHTQTHMRTHSSMYTPTYSHTHTHTMYIYHMCTHSHTHTHIPRTYVHHMHTHVRTRTTCTLPSSTIHTGSASGKTAPHLEHCLLSGPFSSSLLLLLTTELEKEHNPPLSPPDISSKSTLNTILLPQP